MTDAVTLDREITVGRHILRHNPDQGEEFVVDAESPMVLAGAAGEEPLWEVWLNGEPVDVIAGDRFVSAIHVARYLENLKERDTGDTPVNPNTRGFH